MYLKNSNLCNGNQKYIKIYDLYFSYDYVYFHNNIRYYYDNNNKIISLTNSIALYILDNNNVLSISILREYRRSS